MNFTVGQKIRAVYWIGVYKPNIGGFRTEMVSAELEAISPRTARVIQANLEPAHTNRQRCNASYAASKQIGAVKFISKLGNVEVIE